MDNSAVPPLPSEPINPPSAPAPHPLSLRPISMALTLIFGVLLGVGGLFAYQEYAATPAVNSYAECVKAKGSSIQESYPATCVTRDNRRFVQPVQEEEPRPDNPVTTYISPQAHISLTLPKPMYVTDTITGEDGWRRGSIIISTRPGGNEETSSLTIVYGIPAIDGKGGACISEDGTTHWQQKTILGNTVNVCDTGTELHAGYPMHPTEKIEYAFFIGGMNRTAEEFALYKQILYEGLAYSPVAAFPMETFVCPKTAWVDCMPGPDLTEKIECTDEFLTWAKTSCPGFEGAAL